MPKTANRSLHDARSAKKDEFYTQLTDIEKEVKHYWGHFKGKTVLCNCDDPRISKFFHYFAYNFEFLGLKKLITTCYKNQQRDLFSTHDAERAIYLAYDGARPGERVPHVDEIGVHALKGDGDFRSAECIDLLKQADIVVTNPPFSLFREYVAQLVQYDKQFLIIGNKNAITYKETFKLIKENKLWVGYMPMGQDLLFDVPEATAKGMMETKKEGSSYRVVDGAVKARAQAVWYTNLSHKKRYEDLILYRRYAGHEGNYPTYDNYDAIEVSKTKDIPQDYAGAMGVPITFLDKYNPEQFEILGIANSARWIGYECYTVINGRKIYNRLIIRNKKPMPPL